MGRGNKGGVGDGEGRWTNPLMYWASFVCWLVGLGLFFVSSTRFFFSGGGGAGSSNVSVCTERKALQLARVLVVCYRLP